MNDTIIIKMQTINWSCGEVAFFDLLIKDFASVRIGWGDGHTSSTKGNGNWQRVEHLYSVSRKEEGEMFQITIEADGKESIMGFRNWSMDMDTIEVNVRQCHALKFLSASSLNALDISRCRFLEELDISNARFEQIDISNNPELKELKCDYSSLIRLDLSRCNQLTTLSCRGCRNLTHIGISNDSAIKNFTIDDNTPVNGKCLYHLQRIITGNVDEKCIN